MQPRPLLLSLILLASVDAGAACVERLAPASVVALPRPEFLRARDVTWQDDGRVLIGGSAGIRSYTLATGASASLVRESEIKEVQRLESDGVTVVATNMEFTDIAADARTGNVRERRQRMAMGITDLSVHGTTMAVLGVPRRIPGVEYGTVWLGSVGAPWESFSQLRPTPADRVDVVRKTFPPYGGAILQMRDGSIAAVTPYEPGVLRFGPDGARLATLGADVRDLVIEKFAELMDRFASDVEGRYVHILNRQRTIDDLVSTSDGLAVVVRRFDAGTVFWELWFPGPKTIRRTVRLDLDQKQIAGPHLRCDARGSRLACIFGKQIKPLQPEDPQLVLFDISKTRKAGCN